MAHAHQAGIPLKWWQVKGSLCSHLHACLLAIRDTSGIWECREDLDCARHWHGLRKSVVPLRDSLRLQTRSRAHQLGLAGFAAVPRSDLATLQQQDQYKCPRPNAFLSTEKLNLSATTTGLAAGIYHIGCPTHLVVEIRFAKVLSHGVYTAFDALFRVPNKGLGSSLSCECPDPEE